MNPEMRAARINELKDAIMGSLEGFIMDNSSAEDGGKSEVKEFDAMMDELIELVKGV